MPLTVERIKLLFNGFQTISERSWRNGLNRDATYKDFAALLAGEKYSKDEWAFIDALFKQSVKAAGFDYEHPGW